MNRYCVSLAIPVGKILSGQKRPIKSYQRQRGERFAVRNSGVTAVVEGTSDHGCEYMTGGTVVILEATGRNFAAGISGGVAYVYDVKESFANNCNMEMIDLDPLDGENKQILKALLEEHVSSPGSKVASFILNDLDNQCSNFIKVFPKDYKKVLQGKKLAAKV